jgi:hypothetical protein
MPAGIRICGSVPQCPTIAGAARGRWGDMALRKALQQTRPFAVLVPNPECTMPPPPQNVFTDASMLLAAVTHTMMVTASAPVWQTAGGATAPPPPKRPTRTSCPYANSLLLLSHMLCWYLTFAGAARDRWGHMALRKALQQTHLPARFAAAETVLQCSSLGTLNTKWLEELQDSLNAGQLEQTNSSSPNQGQGFAGSLNAGTKAGGDGGGSSKQQQWPQQLMQQQQQRQRQRRPRLHFVWPTAEDVRGSIEGWAAGGSIPARSNNIRSDCLQQLFRR